MHTAVTFLHSLNNIHFVSVIDNDVLISVVCVLTSSNGCKHRQRMIGGKKQSCILIEVTHKYTPSRIRRKRPATPSWHATENPQGCVGAGSSQVMIGVFKKHFIYII